LAIRRGTDSDRAWGLELDFRLTRGSGYRPALLLFVLAWTILAWPWLSGSVTIPYDAKAHFHAQIQFLANAIHTGQSPFWSPNVFAGSPHIADPQSLIFSPAILLAIFSSSPSFRAVDTFILLHLLAGGIAVMLFFREKGWHAAGAIAAAIIFAFGASAAWRIQHVGQIISLSFFPIALWLTARALARRSAVSGVLAGLAAGLMMVEPNQVALMGAYILVGYVVDHWLQGGRAAVMASIRPLSAATLAGATMIALPLIWTVLFAGITTRPAIEFAEAARGSLHPASLLTAWVADLFGAFDPNVEFWGPYSTTWSTNELFLSQNMGQLYMGGLAGLLLLVPGLTRLWLWDRSIRALSIMALVAVLFALGRYTPVFYVIFKLVPGIDAFRRPADATFLIGVLCAILTGYVIHRCLTGETFRLARREWLAIAALVSAAGLVSLAIAGSVDHVADTVAPLLNSLAWLAAALGSLLLMHWVSRRQATVAIGLLATVITADLAANNGPNDSTALPPEAYDVLRIDTKNETVALLKKLTARVPGSPRRDRVELLGLGFDWPNCGMIHGFEHTLGYNPLRLAEFSDAVGTRDTIAGPDQRKFTALFPSYRSHLANMIGLRYVASSVPVGQIDKKLKIGDLKLVGLTKEGYVYENTQALPRAMFVGGWQVADFDTLRASGNWPDFDPKRTVLIEGEPPELSPATASDSPVTLTMPRYENTEVEIDVETEKAGFVVLYDVWHPWWAAEVNGIETEILKANVIFRAVQVPAGKSKIRFTFRPVEGAIAELREKVSPSEE
jgi:hypothetical protein